MFLKLFVPSELRVFLIYLCPPIPQKNTKYLKQTQQKTKKPKNKMNTANKKKERYSLKRKSFGRGTELYLTVP